jgi:benzylsuccinate CoA-transferase BbsE subunit
LLQLALEHGFLITPVTTVAEVVESPQFASRDYFQNVAHPELGGSFRYPGPFAKFSATPIEYRLRPPRVGEHNSEIYRDELGLSDRELTELTRARIV